MEENDKQTNVKEEQVLEGKPVQSTVTSGNQNLMGAIAYFLVFVSGIALLIVEKENKYVRFHAMQSTIFFGGCFILGIFLRYIPVLGWMMMPVLGLLELVMWVVLMYKAYSGEKYKLPYVGELAEKQLTKIR